MAIEHASRPTTRRRRRRSSSAPTPACVTDDGRDVRVGARARWAAWPCAGTRRSATTRTPRSRRRRSWSSTACATRSPATSPRSTPTARCACSAAAASASTPAARRCTRRRSRRCSSCTPTVADAAVVGVPDERFGEAITALVEAHAGDEISEADLIAHVKARLAGYKAPKRVLRSAVRRAGRQRQARLPRPEGARRRCSETHDLARSSRSETIAPTDQPVEASPHRRRSAKLRRARAGRRTSRRRGAIRAVTDADRRPSSSPSWWRSSSSRTATRRTSSCCSSTSRRRCGWPSPSPSSSAPCSTASSRCGGADASAGAPERASLPLTVTPPSYDEAVFEVPTSLSPSRVEQFTSCPLAFRFASIERLPERPSIHATRGSLVHRALELAYMLARRRARGAGVRSGAGDRARRVPGRIPTSPASG